MVGFSLNMTILFPNIIRCGKKDFSFTARQKAYAAGWR
jgi:hypothetical protein